LITDTVWEFGIGYPKQGHSWYWNGASFIHGQYTTRRISNYYTLHWSSVCNVYSNWFKITFL